MRADIVSLVSMEVGAASDGKLAGHTRVAAPCKESGVVMWKKRIAAAPLTSSRWKQEGGVQQRP